MNSGSWDRLVTDRLVLRRFRPDDRGPFARINADEEVTRYLSGPMSRAESDAFVDRIDQHWAAWGYGLYAVEHRTDGDLLGFVGLSHHRAQPHAVEVGWRLAVAAWGRGLATEGARAVVRVAFGDIGLDSLVSITTDENMASRRVMDKLGFRYVRHIPFERWNLRVAALERESAPLPEE